VARWGIIATVVLGLLLAGARPGLADEPVNPLAMMLERLVKAVEWQANYLEVAETLAVRTQEWIDDQAGKGKDTAELQASLDTFKDGLKDALEHHEKAATILQEHEGFDDDGAVTDRMKAYNTIMKAARALGDAQRALWRGMIELRGATGDWRRLHQSWRERNRTSDAGAS